MTVESMSETAVRVIVMASPVLVVGGLIVAAFVWRIRAAHRAAREQGARLARDVGARSFSAEPNRWRMDVGDVEIVVERLSSSVGADALRHALRHPERLGGALPLDDGVHPFRVTAVGAPDFALCVSRKGDRLARVVDLPVASGGDSTFDAAFTVKADDEARLQGCLSAEVRGWIARAPSYTFTIEDGRVTALGGRRDPDEEVRARLEEARRTGGKAAVRFDTEADPEALAAAVRVVAALAAASTLAPRVRHEISG